MRDKLKRLEQETQRMRTERLDMVKKLEQKQEENSKALQKQIEYKDLENQFKTQEIIELQMKNKYLESNLKKNVNLVSCQQIQSQYEQPQQPQQPQQIQLHQQLQQAQIITKPKNTPTKRMAPSQLGTSSLSDTENDDPFLVVKRPNLNSLVTSTSTIAPQKTNRTPMMSNNLNNNQTNKMVGLIY